MKHLLLFFIVTVGAMPAAAFTTIASFEMILFRKTSITFRGQVIITFFWWDVFFEELHMQIYELQLQRIKKDIVSVRN